MDGDLVLVERRAEGVVLVTINRPEALNALNFALRKALAEAFLALHDDAEVRCIVLTGSERAFVAGADLRDFADLDAIALMKRRIERYWNAVAATPQPVIAAVRGYAFGGGLELAMACDIIVAGETAELGQPEIRVGIMPGAGGTQRLTRAVGKYHAMRMCLTGKPVTGREAFAMGLASEVVPDAEVLEAALKLAETIARQPPLAAQAIKEAIVQGADAALGAAMLMERRSFQLTFASADKAEGMAAFLGKRKPEFRGE